MTYFYFRLNEAELPETFDVEIVLNIFCKDIFFLDISDVVDYRDIHRGYGVAWACPKNIG